jgi:hypothetical protein
MLNPDASLIGVSLAPHQRPEFEIDLIAHAEVHQAAPTAQFLG